MFLWSRYGVLCSIIVYPHWILASVIFSANILKRKKTSFLLITLAEIKKKTHTCTYITAIWKVLNLTCSFDNKSALKIFVKEIKTMFLCRTYPSDDAWLLRKKKQQISTVINGRPRKMREREKKGRSGKRRIVR